MISSKGFSLLEMLIVVFIVSSLTVIATKNFVIPDFDYIYLTNDIIDSHVNALTNRVQDDVLNKYTNDYIYFNESGNINKGQTINIGNHNIILHLGNGYLVNE